MKRANNTLILLLILGFIAGIIGTILKITWGNSSDIFLLISLIFTPTSLLGLVFVNQKRIIKAVFGKYVD